MIEKYTNVFDEEFCYLLYEDCFKIISNNTQYVWRSNYSWNNYVFDGSYPVLCRLLDTELANTVLHKLKDKDIISHDNYSVSNFTWTRLSHIPWHNDSYGDAIGEAITIYLNPTWEKNWGGLFLYLEDDVEDIRGIFPHFNSAIKVTKGTLHSVSHISPSAKYPRYTLQLFPKSN